MSSAITERLREFLEGRGQGIALAAPVAVAACLLLVLQIQEGALRIAAHGRDRVSMRAVRALSVPLALIFGLALLGHFVRFFQ
jgi:hypothetical protein